MKTLSHSSGRLACSCGLFSSSRSADESMVISWQSGAGRQAYALFYQRWGHGQHWFYIHVHLRIAFLYDKLSRKSFVPCQLYRIIPETKRKQGFRNVHAWLKLFFFYHEREIDSVCCVCSSRASDPETILNEKKEITKGVWLVSFKLSNRPCMHTFSSFTQVTGVWFVTASAILC